MPHRHPLRAFFLVLCASLLFAGCITIRESYTFSKDGSGSMQLVFDMSKMAEMFKEAGMDPDKAGKGKGSDVFEDKLPQLKTLPGVSKVKRSSKDYVESVSFSFADVRALNAALNVLMNDSSGVDHTFFAWEGSTLVRHSNKFTDNVTGDEEIFGGMGEEGSEEKVKELLKTMRYEVSLAFAEEIDGAEIPVGAERTASDAKSVGVAADFSVLSDDPHVLDLRIKLAR